MAYIGTERELAMWMAGAPHEDGLAETCIYLLGDDGDPGDEAYSRSEPSRGFIIQDWFGPFLLGPPSRFLRGRC
ncbi:MAG: hypothetical protein QME75_03220 [Deltaproteobacteria bacterium]|nr:hypothetical protein [Deltaproteobacteria bacterium]